MPSHVKIVLSISHAKIPCVFKKKKKEYQLDSKQEEESIVTLKIKMSSCPAIMTHSVMEKV